METASDRNLRPSTVAQSKRKQKSTKRSARHPALRNGNNRSDDFSAYSVFKLFNERLAECTTLEGAREDWDVIRQQFRLPAVSNVLDTSSFIHTLTSAERTTLSLNFKPNPPLADKVMASCRIPLCKPIERLAEIKNVAKYGVHFDWQSKNIRCVVNFAPISAFGWGALRKIANQHINADYILAKMKAMQILCYRISEEHYMQVDDVSLLNVLTDKDIVENIVPAERIVILGYVVSQTETHNGLPLIMVDYIDTLCKGYGFAEMMCDALWNVQPSAIIVPTSPTADAAQYWMRMNQKWNFVRKVFALCNSSQATFQEFARKKLNWSNSFMDMVQSSMRSDST